VYHTFFDNSSFLDDTILDAHTNLSQIHWNAKKETLMNFAANMSDLYAKLNNTEAEQHCDVKCKIKKINFMQWPFPPGGTMM